MSNGFQEEIASRIRAGYQCLLVPTSEEARCDRELERVAKLLDYEIITWDAIEGFSSVGDTHNTRNACEALCTIPDSKAFSTRKALMVFKDLHNFYPNPDVRRAIRSLTAKRSFKNKIVHRPLIIVQASSALHPELASCATTVEFELPTHAQLLEEIDHVNQTAIEDKTKRLTSTELRHRTAQGLLGLTSVEASDCLALCLIRHGGFKEEMIETIESIKAGVLRRSEILSYTPRNQLRKASDIGGYDEMMAFVTQRALAYTPEAAAIKLDMPKGIVLVGIPGSGKSVVTECIAQILGLPLVNFDFSAVFNSLVGESERRTREVISLAAAMGGCVLVIDEADKALGGAVDSTGDSGVTRRVFGQVLTWLAKKNDRTFVVMTMNRIKGMPPELLRRGRFDEIFYVDLPTPEERRAIFNIHLSNRGIDPRAYTDKDWTQIINTSNDMVGSEIEEVVKTSRFAAFQASDKKTAAPSAAQMLAAIEEVSATKVVTVDAENIRSIREFGEGKARPVSSAKRTKKGRQTRSIDLSSPFRGDN